MKHCYSAVDSLTSSGLKMVPCVFPEEIGPRLNDLFGIQARGGCACAGPYGQNLLGLDASTAHAFDKARGGEVVGWKGVFSWRIWGMKSLNDKTKC